MRHRVTTRRLGRCSSHRWAMLGNMAASLFIEGSIVTTATRAKEVRRVAEKLITKAKSGSLNDRRLVVARLPHKEAVTKLLNNRDGLMLGICNGFQALVKSGLLPYGRLGLVTRESPTLFRNDINRHVSQIVSTRVATTNSPWLSSFSVGDIHSIAVSHGEGKFVVNEPLARELFENGQVAFQYVDAEGRVTAEAPYNPNGSYYAIEGIVSRDGQILGKMGHTERYGENLFKNIAGEKVQDIFTNAVNYFRKTK